jgi:membrane associated rhomboid family serine protease
LIPLRHTLPQHAPPVVNRTLVALNTVIFIGMVFLGSRSEMLINTFGFIPARFIDPAAYGSDRLHVSVTLITSLFIHGGFVHLFGNMIYLWVFGGPVEDALGHFRYLLFFVLCGVVGSLVHTMVFPRSPIPSIGASGSIAGVLGAFLVLRPRARIVTLFPLVVYWAMAETRAIVFLPIWFAMQFFNGFLSLSAAARAEQMVGVAWWAHIGGFLFGAAVGAGVRVFRRGSTRDTT